MTPTRTQTGPFHRRHVRTIQEVRTTITRVITDVYYEDGKEVDRKVVEVRLRDINVNEALETLLQICARVL